jgi:hypothetical protein
LASKSTTSRKPPANETLVCDINDIIYIHRKTSALITPFASTAWREKRKVACHTIALSTVFTHDEQETPASMAGAERSR